MSATHLLRGALGLLMVSSAAGVHAQSATSPPGAAQAASTAMPSDVMGNMPMTPAKPPSGSMAVPPMPMTPDPSLERPAASQQYQPPPMSGMDMDDATNQHLIYLENLEAVSGTRNGGAWDVQGWYGGDFNKLWLKSEGETLGNRTAGSKVEALWAHSILPFWDSQVGMRYDFSGGPSREWLAFGFQGISPLWFDIEATGYVGNAGRTAARLKTEYDLYFTQRLILRPEMELNGYGKADPQRQIGAGFSDGQFAVRLRYEFTRGFAPYVGFVYDRKFGASATYARRDGEYALDHRAVAGLQLLF